MQTEALLLILLSVVLTSFLNQTSPYLVQGTCTPCLPTLGICFEIQLEPDKGFLILNRSEYLLRRKNCKHYGRNQIQDYSNFLLQVKAAFQIVCLWSKSKEQLLLVWFPPLFQTCQSEQCYPVTSLYKQGYPVMKQEEQRL